MYAFTRGQCATTICYFHCVTWYWSDAAVLIRTDDVWCGRQGSEWHRYRTEFGKRMVSQTEVTRLVGPINDVTDDFITKLRHVRDNEGQLAVVDKLTKESHNWSMEGQSTVTTWPLNLVTNLTRWPILTSATSCCRPSTKYLFNLLEHRGSTVIVPHRIVWSWYTGRWWVGCYIWYSEEGLGGAKARPGPSINGQCSNHRIAV